MGILTFAIPTVPKYSSMITPFVRLVIRHYRQAMFFMHPCQFYFSIDEDQLVQINILPNTWRLIPFYLSFYGLTGIVALGSCSFVFFAQSFGYELTQRVEPYQRYWIGTVGAIGFFQVVGLRLVLRFPQVFDTVNQVAVVERRCECTKFHLFRIKMLFS